MSNVLLLNYLIAILSQTYSVMEESGSFNYKVNLYQYCERYIIAFKSEAYGQFVLQPAPLCLLNFPLVLISLIPKRFMVTPTIYFSWFMYWLENIVYLIFFILYEIVLIPLVYVKNIFVIMWASLGFFTTVFNTCFWIFTGLFYCVVMAVRDVYYFLKIMTMMDGCRSAGNWVDELAKEPIEKELEIRVFNEARETVIEQYMEIKKQLRGGIQDDAGREEEKKIDFKELDILDMLEKDKNLFEDDKDK